MSEKLRLKVGQEPRYIKNEDQRGSFLLRPLSPLTPYPSRRVGSTQHLALAVFRQAQGKGKGRGGIHLKVPHPMLHASCECGRACDPGRISLPRSIS